MVGPGRSQSLFLRIVGSVVLSLSLILLLFGLVALWTIQETVQTTYRERVRLVQVAARQADTTLWFIQHLVEQQAARLTLEPGQSLTEGQLRQLASLDSLASLFLRLTIVDSSEQIRWINPPVVVAEGRPPTVQACLQPTLATGSSHLGVAPHPTGPVSGGVCLAAPLRDSVGRVSGALIAELDPSVLVASFAPSTDQDVSMVIQVVDDHGQAVGATQMVNAPGQAVGATQEAGHASLLAPLIAERTAGYAIHRIAAGNEDATHLVAYAPLTGHPTWGVIIEQPRDAALAVPRHLAWRWAVFGLVTLGFVALVAWFDVRRIVRPLQQLTAAARRFATGELAEPIALRQADELGVLATALETMRRRLQGSMTELADLNQDLEHRVTVRTAEVEARNRELAHLNAIAETVTGSIDMPSMLEQTLDRVIAISGADAGSFHVLTEDDAHLRTVTTRGFPASPDNWSVELDRSVSGNHQRDSLLDELSEAVTSAYQMAGLRSCLAVPLASSQGFQGILALGARQSDYFGPTEQRALLAIGHQVGLALATARLYDSLRRREQERAELLQQVMTGQEEERRRLAQELHDDTSQALASLRLGLERLAGGALEASETRRLADQLRQVAAETLTEVRRLAAELRPGVLDDAGLVVAIDRLLQATAQRWPITVDFAAVGVDDVRLLHASEIAIYRIVQAALVNVVHHAAATHVSVLVKRRGHRLVLVVEDDGRGFDLAAIRADRLTNRLGLAGMEERAALIGATLTIETAPGAGTTVFLEVPLTINQLREASDAEIARPVG